MLDPNIISNDLEIVVLMEDENGFTMVRTGYSAIGTYIELGDYMVTTNPFYINGPIREIMGKEKHSTA